MSHLRPSLVSCVRFVRRIPGQSQLCDSKPTTLFFMSIPHSRGDEIGSMVLTSKEVRLREAQRHHARSAYAQAQCGDVRQAIVNLEQGQALMMAESLERERMWPRRFGLTGKQKLPE